jgi:hypothetical protein
MRRLNEVSFADLTPLGESLKRHLGQNRYIHFTKGIQLPQQRSPAGPAKIGINPKKHHLDPPGVYFYPVDWLWNHEDFHDHQQFATNWPNWIIAELDLTSKGLDLSAISEKEIEALGERNGWLEEYKSFEPNYSPRNGVAENMWDVLKSLNQRQGAARLQWLRSLRGLNWVKDTKGIILSNEPHQVCAINPRIIRIVESGKQPMIHQHEWEEYSYWRYALSKLFTTLEKEHGGKITWKNKFPTWKVAGENWSFALSWRDSWSMRGLVMEWQYGRSQDTSSISTRVMRDTRFDQLKEMIEERLLDVKNTTGDDIQFSSMISPIQAEELINKMMFEAGEAEFEVFNKDRFLRASVKRKEGKKPEIETEFSVGVSDTEVWITCNITINGNRIFNLGKASPDEFEDKFWKAFKAYSENIVGYAPTYDSPKRINENEWTAFLGWLFVRTGLFVFEDFENAYYEFENKSHLYGQINYTFDRVRW